MTQQTQAVTKAPVTVLTCLETDRWKTEAVKVLPPDLKLEAFFRVARNMVSGNSNLAQCDPQSFFLAMLKCGRAGLYPDGREAHLIPFGKQVQAIFDWKGLVALARRGGTEVTAKVVHENDEFTVQEDDGTGKTVIIHNVNYKQHRGDMVAVWSRARSTNGIVDYEVMTKDECEEVRQKFSKAKDSDAWKKSYGEMCKKTCIRRHSKRWDMSPEIREAFNSDDDSPTFAALPTAAPKLKEEPPAVEVEATVTPTSAVVESVRSKCAKSKIGEGKLLEFLKSICPLREDATTLEMAGADVPDTLAMIDEQWEDVSKRIHETKT